MGTLKQVNVPDELLAAIEVRARAHGITVEEQVVRDLSLVQGVNGGDEQALLTEIRREREAMASKGVYLTEDFLRQAKNWGRK